ncbi:MAG: 4'-phosphopantetheinyl transferase superfamily protein [Gammaproteobacteria bacterium]|nr:4'-phosphopantetheinyl transferase superfamily protein [Gammaproteobacteria bacterium]
MVSELFDNIKVDRLSAGVINLWEIYLPNVTSYYDELYAILSLSEREQAGRFVFAQDRERFVLSHGLLRVLLGKYLSIAEHDLEFDVGAYGKPSLGANKFSINLQFNLSHSHDVACFAFTLDHAVGVDVEYMREDFAGSDIAKRYFSAQEYKQLVSLPQGAQKESFFKCWTRKEAFIKAIGKGLSFGLDKFDVELVADAGQLLTAVRGGDYDVADWSVFAVDVRAGYFGAVAGRSDSQLRICRF